MLSREFAVRGIPFRREVSLPVNYKGVMLDCGYRLDFVVADTVVVEVKAVKEIENVHEAQFLTNLRLSGCKIGLMFNFHAEYLRQGIVRRIL